MLFVAVVRYIPEGMRLTAAPKIKSPILRQLAKLIFLPLLIEYMPVYPRRPRAAPSNW